MTISLRFISAEDDNFIREVKIDGEATFLDLHHFIQQLLDFDPSQMASFFMTDEDWQKNEEITLIDMIMDEGNNSLIMSEIPLNQFISNVKQRMIYTFDLFNDRNLFIEVHGIENSSCATPQCIRENGPAPEQLDMSMLLESAMGEPSTDKKYDFDDEDYGFDDDDFDDPMITYTDDLDDY